MTLKIVAVGRIKEKYLQSGIDEYKKRLSPWLSLNITEVKESKNTNNLAEALEEEGERLFKQVRKDSFLIVLTPEGSRFSSTGLAQKIESLLASGNSKIDIIVGGPEGISARLKESAHLKLSLSSLTFSSQIARFLITEQLYRSMKIIKKEPYHRE